MIKREHRDSNGRYQYLEPLQPEDVPGLPEIIGGLVLAGILIYFCVYVVMAL
jgi:hypothetical protein